MTKTKEAKHTPGPWKAESAAGQHDTAGWMVLGRSRLVASVSNLWEDAEANARLIAAAPELLEALKNIVDWFDVKRDLNDGAQSETLKEALAALDKAEAK